MTALFDWRVRGFRVVEIMGVVLLAAIIVSVYFAKAQAARQSADIDGLQRAISTERARLRLLSAEAARLEDPARLEMLSRQAGLEPVSVEQRATLDVLEPLAETADSEAGAAG